MRQQQTPHPYAKKSIPAVATPPKEHASGLTAQDCERGGFLVPLSLWGKLAPKREPAIVYLLFTTGKSMNNANPNKKLFRPEREK